MIPPMRDFYEHNNTRLLAGFALLVWSAGWLLVAVLLYRTGTLAVNLALLLGAYPTGAVAIIGTAAVKSHKDKALNGGKK